MQEVRLNHIRDVSAALVGIALVIFGLYTFQSFLMPLATALMLLFIFGPLTRLSRRGKVIFWSTLVVTLLFFFGIVSLLGALIVHDFQEFQSDDTPPEERIKKQIESVEFSVGSRNFALADILNNERVAQLLASFIRAIGGAVTDAFSNIFLVLLFLIFLIPSYKKLHEHLKTSKDKKFSVLMHIEQSVRSYLMVKSSMGFLNAILYGIIMLLLGVDYIFALMILVFFMNFIPNVGAYISIAIIVLLHIFETGITFDIPLLIITFTAVEMLIGNFIEPKIAGKTTELSPIIILLSLFFWGYLWGIWGMLISVPLTVTLRIIIEDIIKDQKTLRKKT